MRPVSVEGLLQDALPSTNSPSILSLLLPLHLLLPLKIRCKAPPRSITPHVLIIFLRILIIMFYSHHIVISLWILWPAPPILCRCCLWEPLPLLQAVHQVHMTFTSHHPLSMSCHTYHHDQQIILIAIREQVHPAYTALSEFFDVEFVAYGGASVSNPTQ